MVEQMPAVRVDPYATVDWDAVSRLRDQLHVHTDRTKGTLGAHEVVDCYVDELDRDVLAISGRSYNAPALWPWTEFARIGRREALSWEDRTPADVVAIEATEFTVRDHHLCLFTSVLDSDVPEPASNREQIRLLADAGGVVVCCHPHFSGYGADDWRHFTRLYETFPPDALLGQEIWTSVEDYDDGRTGGHPNDEDLWDEVLARWHGERNVYGLSVDDPPGSTMRTDGIGRPIGRYFNVVFARERTPAAVRDAYVAGHFYPVRLRSWEHADEPRPSPPRLERARVTTEAIEVTVGGDVAVTWISDGRPVHEGCCLPLDTPGMRTYVRARLQTDDGCLASTQPYLLNG